ncbi:TPA: colicin release lysis protein [Escherichia coli]|nr:colicin release lysis protein [Escherichia coli]
MTGVWKYRGKSTACQVNNVRDTGGGSVSPSSTVTGVSMGSSEPVPVFPARTPV